MPDERRRLILRPPQVAPDQWAQLGEALIEAVSVQNRLAAKSPYILRFTGPVQEDDAALVVPHEPATPWSPHDLFDPDGPPAPYDQLLATTAALLDALAAAHAPSSGGSRPTAHGGLCPGVLLTGEDGLIKVTDFGFAPAFCKVLGVDACLNLAAGPHGAASGAWEIVPGHVIDRDDRLCAFIDPDKYGQGTLTTFEAGSDIIAAGIILRLLAEHRHPYLFYEPEAHRVVDMAQMMSFGVPVPVAREDLSRNERSDVRAWCDLVSAMVARLPSERPPVTELIRRLKAFAPQATDVSLLKARRWVAQLEALRDDGAWRDLEVALKDRPAVEEWPADLLARADTLAQQVRDRLAEAARQAAIEEQHRTAQKWFDRLRSAVQDAQWDAARKLLATRPTLEHWPESVHRELEPLTAQVTAGLARQEAREWLSDLEADFRAKDWAAVGQRLDARPPEQHWPPDVRDAVPVIETAYRKHLDEQERERRRIASQHSEVRGWLERARGLAAQRLWVPTLDVLATPPKVEHWPPGAHQDAEQLAAECRAQLGDKVVANLESVNAALARLATAAVEAVIQERLTGLLRPAHVEVVVENVIWGAEDDADGHAPVRATLRSAGAVPPPAARTRAPREPLPHGRGLDQAMEPQPIRGELYFQFRGDEPHITRGITEWQEALATNLAAQVGRLQEDRLAAFERQCRASLFRQASLATDLKPPQQQAQIHLALLGPGSHEGTLAVALRWDDAALRWEPADPRHCREQAVEVAAAAGRRAAWSAVLAASPTLRAYEPLVAFEFVARPPDGGDVWPRELAFDAKVAIRLGKQGTAEPLAGGRVTCDQVGQVALDADFQQVESRLTRVIVRAEEDSRKNWEAKLKQALRDASPKARLVAPGRIKTPADNLTFEIRPRSGDPVVIRGQWDTKRLVFDLAGWEAALGALAGPPVSQRAEVAQPPPAQQPRPSGEAAAPPDLTGETPTPPDATPTPLDAKPTPPIAAPKVTAPKSARAARRRPKGVIYGVAAASVVVVAVGIYVWPWRLVSPAPLPVPEPSPVVNDTPTVVPDDGSVAMPPAPEPEVFPPAVEPLDVAVSQPPDEEPVVSPGEVPEPVVSAPPLEADTPVEVSREELAAAVSEAEATVAGHLSRGELRLAHEVAAGVRDIVELPILNGSPEVARLRQTLEAVPPPWTHVAGELAAQGYRAAEELDTATSYPVRLRDSEGRDLLLVSLSPSDNLWAKLAAVGDRIKPDHPLHELVRNPAERHWFLFYVDADEFPADTPQAAEAEAARRGRRLPTRDEWFLAALRLRDNTAARDLFGGLWEWCGTSDQGYWLCGGSRVLVKRPAGELRLPTAADDLERWWKWLTHPFVMQRRAAEFGDELTGARGLFPVFPAP